MPSDAFDFDALMLRFRALGHRDRRAVLAQLAPSDRSRVEVAVAADIEARRRETDHIRRAGRQFADYSTWLSPTVQAACKAETATQPGQTLAVMQAIADIHRTLQSEAASTPARPSALIRRWGAALFQPSREDRL